ncbi:sn-glycerol-1-phosphate dehydrogenase [Alkalihalophilus lindianensis]|uniref:Sn-glycerol-1-phosphate dehydrogenase n=1 Tax=Alkalihalophilus lindianensis TaxID=1630542 RepID=A0ABU3XCN4_9BACI|nr:sn-glycerol-1-phosphate dehydrogenase [Alkalihalophilus lindianensis]MDV2685635.1 sn-glycerol-1-phosphate dehydrogenase [Alkalihalophilus lindianensis]
MESFNLWYGKHREACTCGSEHHLAVTERFEIGDEAFLLLRSFLSEKNYKNVLLVYDENTWEVAGAKVFSLLNGSGFHVKGSKIPANNQGDVIANEESIVHALLAASEETEVFIAVGAGTIHDITRFVSYKMGLPFISVPTAPSVDGFNSKGAPIVVRKKKVTFQTHAPVGLFADTKVLCNAPQEMVAAGFGDMLGKYTSLADWRFGHLTGGEPYCEAAAKMTEEALEACIGHARLIAEKNEKGIIELMNALIMSGLAMSLFGHSHPASGGEHHLSHYWEMKFLEEDRKQLLHGEKVGVSCALIADFYKEEKEKLLEASSEDAAKQIEKILAWIPEGNVLRKYLKQIGGSATLEDIGIEESLINESLASAHSIRDRKTMLRYLNESKMRTV